MNFIVTLFDDLKTDSVEKTRNIFFSTWFENIFINISLLRDVERIKFPLFNKTNDTMKEKVITENNSKYGKNYCFYVN